MNKTTTALTELIERIDKGMLALGSSHVATAMKSALEVYKDEAISLLQKERQDIRNAFIDGKINANTANRLGCHEDTGNTYFTNNFTQHKTETNG